MLGFCSLTYFIIISMQTPSRRPAATLQKIITNFGFIGLMLNADSLSPFKELMQVVFASIMDVPSHRAEGAAVAGEVGTLLGLLRRKEKEVSVNSIVKKLAVIHSLVYKFGGKEYWHEELETVLRMEVNRILREDLPEVVNYKEKKEKRENSLTKFYHYVRELSGSRDSKGKNRLQVEGQSDKGTIREMATRIIEPFCLYLLKILQDNAIYCSLIRNHQQTNSHEIDWKMINWGRGLTDIVIELNRLSRYFGSDMLGILVYIAYLLSVDLSIYYQRLKIRIYKLSLRWTEEIVEVRARNKARGLHFSQLNEELLDDPRMQEARDQIMEVKQMREKLNYVYFNKQWKEWRREFARADEFKATGDAEFERCIDDVLEFIDDSERQRGKLNLYRKLVRKDAIELSLFDDIDLTKESIEPDSPPLGVVQLGKGVRVRRNQLMGREGGYRHTLLRVEE